MRPNRSKFEKGAIMRIRQREEETKKYYAPIDQALIIGVCGLLALAAGGYGLSPIPLDIMLLQLSAVSILNFAFWPLRLARFPLESDQRTPSTHRRSLNRRLTLCRTSILPYCVYIVPIINASIYCVLLGAGWANMDPRQGNLRSRISGRF